MCCANLVRKWPCLCLKPELLDVLCKFSEKTAFACVLNLSHSMCCGNWVRKWPCLCCIHGVHCFKPEREGHLCPFLTISWCAPYRIIMCTPTYVYAWHTHTLAPFKTAKRVKQVEEKETRRLNLPEIVMQMIQKVERWCGLGVCGTSTICLKVAMMCKINRSQKCTTLQLWMLGVTSCYSFLCQIAHIKLILLLLSQYILLILCTDFVWFVAELTT